MQTNVPTGNHIHPIWEEEIFSKLEQKPYKLIQYLQYSHSHSFLLLQPSTRSFKGKSKMSFLVIQEYKTTMSEIHNYKSIQAQVPDNYVNNQTKSPRKSAQKTYKHQLHIPLDPLDNDNHLQHRQTLAPQDETHWASQTEVVLQSLIAPHAQRQKLQGPFVEQYSFPEIIEG